MFMPIQFSLTRIRNRALGLIALALLAGCSKPPDFQCPESMDAEDYTLDSLKKLTKIQLLETRLEEVSRQCEIPTQKSFDFAELLLKVAREGTPEQAMWLYERIQSRSVAFRKTYLAESGYLGITKPALPNSRKKLTLVSPKEIGENIKVAKISLEQAALAKTKYIEDGIAQNPDDGRRIVHFSDDAEPVLMQVTLEGNAAGDTTKIQFNSLSSGKEISLKSVADYVPEWKPAGYNSRATGLDRGDYRFVVDENGHIKYAIEYWVSADFSEVDWSGGAVPDSTPCNTTTNVIELSKNGLKYISELEVRSNITYGTYEALPSVDNLSGPGFSDDVFSSMFKGLATYAPLPNVAKHINFARNDEADQLLIAQLREQGRAGRLQLLNAIYATYPFPKEEDPKTPAKNLIAQFDAAAGVVNAFNKAFSGVDPLMRASTFGLFEATQAYNSVSKDLKSNMPPEPIPDNPFKLTTLFIKNEFPQRPGSPYRFSYEAYRIPDRKPFVVVANHPAFSSQGLITFYGKELDVGGVQFQSSLSGFSVEAPVIEIASPEQIDGINDYSKSLGTYKQSIEKLKRLGAHLSEDYYRNRQSVTEAILQTN
jgi:hypothetical protein